MRVTLIRHAESTWNATGRWQGQSDVPLSPRGQVQARALASRMWSASYARRICSDLTRAAITAGALGATHDPDPRFREIDVGEWAGLTRPEVAERFPDQVRALRAGEGVRIGGGESIEEFEARVDVALDELGRAHQGEEVLVVTHGGVVRAIAGRALGTRGRTSPLVGVANTAVSVVRHEGERLTIEVYNDGLHLEAAAQDSAFHSVPASMTRLALVAADPEEETPRAVADGLLAGLGIATYYAIGQARAAVLAEHLLADAVAELDLDALLADHEDGSLALVLPPARVPRMVAELLGLGSPEGFAPPPSGAVAQLRLFEEGAELHSYGLSPKFGED